MKHRLTRALCLMIPALLIALSVPFMAVGAESDPSVAVSLPDAVITEICFNTTFMENDFGIDKGTDMLEFIEIKNISGHELNLEGWSVTYRKNGWDSEIAGQNPVTQVSASDAYRLPADAFAVFAVYTKDAATAGLKYDTPEEFVAVYDTFVAVNGGRDVLPPEQFYLIPKVASGGTKNIAGRFNLDNSSTGAVVTFLDGDGDVVCECAYNADERNRNNYSLNFMYTGRVGGHPKASEPFNVASPTPGRIFENQIVPLTFGLTAPDGVTTMPLTLMEYNVCATDSTQTHANGTAVTMKERSDGVVSTVRTYDPDILCLCEINYTWVDCLTEYLDGEDCAYASYGMSSQGATWGAKRINKDTWDLFNMILWKKDRFDPVESGTFWCSRTPDKKGTFSWQDGTVGDFARGINWVILQDKETGGRLFVLCQHIDAKVLNSRIYSARLIAQMATDLSDGLPVLMTGDWNCGDASAAYAELVASGKFADARYRTVSPGDMTLYGTGNSWGGNMKPASRTPIDHCFLTKDTVFVRSARGDMGVFNTEEGLVGSDHNATVYELDVTVDVRPEAQTNPDTETTEETAAETTVDTDPETDDVTDPGTGTEAVPYDVPDATEPQPEVTGGTDEPAQSAADPGDVTGNNGTADPTDTGAPPSDTGCASSVAALLPPVTAFFAAICLTFCRGKKHSGAGTD